MYDATDTSAKFDVQSHPQTSATEEKIRSFLNKPVGWHYNAGKPPVPERISVAVSYLRVLHALGLYETDAFPGVDGEIMVTAYNKKAYYETSFELNGNANFVFRYSDEDRIDEENVSVPRMIAHLLEAIQQAEQEECSTFVLFTQNTTIQEQKSSKTMLSRTAQMGAVPQSLKKAAPQRMANPYVLTSNNTIQTSQVIPPFFGSSMYQSSALIAA